MHDGRSVWSELAATYDRTRALPGDGEHVAPAALAARLRELHASRVLDMGCGTGRFLLPLSREGLRVVGADRSPEMLSMLLAKSASGHPAVVRCDAGQLPFRAAFDAVVFSHFLHLLPSLETFSRELRRVLLPGAHVVVVDTTSGARPARIRVLSIAMPLLKEEWKPWPHTGGDSKDRELFRELIRHLGAREVDTVPIATFPGTVTLREELGHIRDRTWWTFRNYTAEAAGAAAELAERQLVAEGADLDAPVDEPVVVRMLVARA